MSSVTLSEIVDSPEWTLVEDQMRAELAEYRRALHALDPMDPSLAQKCTALIAKIGAIRKLNRRFYESAGLAGVSGEQTLDR